MTARKALVLKNPTVVMGLDDRGHKVAAFSPNRTRVGAVLPPDEQEPAVLVSVSGIGDKRVDMRITCADLRRIDGWVRAALPDGYKKRADLLLLSRIEANLKSGRLTCTDDSGHLVHVVEAMNASRRKPDPEQGSVDGCAGKPEGAPAVAPVRFQSRRILYPDERTEVGRQIKALLAIRDAFNTGTRDDAAVVVLLGQSNLDQLVARVEGILEPFNLAPRARDFVLLAAHERISSAVTCMLEAHSIQPRRYLFGLACTTFDEITVDKAAGRVVFMAGYCLVDHSLENLQGELRKRLSAIPPERSSEVAEQLVSIALRSVSVSTIGGGAPGSGRYNRP